MADPGMSAGRRLPQVWRSAAPLRPHSAGLADHRPHTTRSDAGYPLAFDNSRSQDEPELTYRPVEQTVTELSNKCSTMVWSAACPLAADRADRLPGNAFHPAHTSSTWWSESMRPVGQPRARASSRPPKKHNIGAHLEADQPSQ